MPGKRSGGKRAGAAEGKAAGPGERKPTPEQILAAKTANREATMAKMVQRMEEAKREKALREETGETPGLLHKLSIVYAISSGDESACQVLFVSEPEDVLEFARAIPEDVWEKQKGRKDQISKTEAVLHVMARMQRNMSFRDLQGMTGLTASGVYAHFVKLVPNIAQMTGNRYIPTALDCDAECWEFEETPSAAAALVAVSFVSPPGARSHEHCVGPGDVLRIDWWIRMEGVGIYHTRWPAAP
jgi:hypothetical protein